MLNKILFFILVMMPSSIIVLGQQQPDKLIDHIVGTWKITQVVDVHNKSKNKQEKANATKTTAIAGSNAQGLTILVLRRDGRYKNTDDKNAIDSGSYRVNENHHRLYFESDAHHNNPSEWDVTILNNIMTLQADSTKHVNHFKYVYQLDQGKR